MRRPLFHPRSIVKVVPIRPGLDFAAPKAASEPSPAPKAQAAKPRSLRKRAPPSPAAIIARAAKSPLDVLESVLEPRRPGARDFWSLWLYHAAYLRAHSLRFAGGNLADAEDALSEAMLKAERSFQNAVIRNERAWLLRLVHNACMDRHRNRRRHSRFAKDVGDIEGAAPIMALPDPSPEERLSAREEFGTLAQAMKDLPAFLAEPLLLYLDEEPDAAIAERLHVTKDVVRKRRQMARDILRRAIRS